MRMTTTQDTQAELFNSAVNLLTSGNPVEAESAIASFRNLSDQGHARASFNVAVAYLKGYGVERDPAQAAHFMLQAARQGYTRSYEPLAYMIASGELPESHALIPEGRRFLAHVWHFRARCRRPHSPRLMKHSLPSSPIYLALGPVGYR